MLASHSFATSGHDEAETLLRTPAVLGLEAFFAISGFLVAKSWFTDPRLGAYAIKRGLRLMPAVIAAALFTAFVIGPLLTTLSLGSYLSSPDVYEFVGDNLSLFLIGPVLELPGLFQDTAVGPGVNVPLWTLPVEGLAYVGLGLLGVLGVLRRPRLAGAILLFVVIAAASRRPLGIEVGEGPNEFDPGKVVLGMQLLAIFAAGALFYLYRDRVRLHPGLFAVAVVILVLSFKADDVEVGISCLTVPYIVLFCAYALPTGLTRALTRPGDVSYGIYIYHWPVQQSVFELWGGPLSPALMTAISFPVVYLLALGSWRLVELPALRLKSKLTRSAREHPEADGAPRRALVR